MSPRRIQGEPVSAYRFRYARYCFIWLVALGAALAVLLLWQPSVVQSPAQLLIMVLYVGLPLGTATALLASIGFAIGSGWAAIVERSPMAAEWWPRVRETMRVLFLLPVALFASYLALDGLRTLEVAHPSRRIGGVIEWSTEPIGFAVVVAVYGALGIGLTVHLFRHLRRAYAT